VAEDDAALRSVLERGLREHGYVVDAVADGEEALGYLRTYEYEVAVVDWRMPKLSGLDVVRAVRARRLGVPVLLLTATEELNYDSWIPEKELLSGGPIYCRMSDDRVPQWLPRGLGLVPRRSRVRRTRRVRPASWIAPAPRPRRSTASAELPGAARATSGARPVSGRPAFSLAPYWPPSRS